MDKRQLQLKLWLRALTIFEVKLRTKVAQNRNRYIKTAANEYEKHSSVPAWVVTAHQQNLNDILTAHYSAVIPHFGAMVLDNIKSVRMSLEQKRMTLHTSFMLEWLKTEALRKATMIADTDRSDIQSAIEGGVTDGIGASEIASRIREVTDLTAFRAATIARTETANAATFGSLETAKQAEQDVGVVLMKEWLPTLDNRTRDSHLAMAENPQIIALNEKFLVDGEMLDRPGDPAGKPANIINCRCGIVFEEK